ncbi:hypothetical protein ALT_4874 [Aspergillus lentulus]|uniref:Uncharacterized protein n=1 Tax=Aspergillus lentulus TaxID=293939 RepID=A0AAN5YIA0_ASPLE|nr:hypothetical protein CNMCM6069_005472 [Aspergillus lentulus]KAF4162541.1 hypothetical protein CNMCM6936_001970 [Aspergillus lentulus]KAF4175076.1 hypothetical protein CNMCM8060_007770 [Aspergillus lentulus]KAF4186964.1 hypothetical protein CNMCM7927_004699 [Aspergillus lentulus]KAF4196253.1 hypothetical protein CNMCM8694_005347 [Aspergillus lentulus]
MGSLAAGNEPPDRKQAGALTLRPRTSDAWIKQRTKEQWVETWRQSPHGGHLRVLLPEVTKHSITIYDSLTPVERSVPAQMRTGKIGLNHYLSTINWADELPLPVWPGPRDVPLYNSWQPAIIHYYILLVTPTGTVLPPAAPTRAPAWYRHAVWGPPEALKQPCPVVAPQNPSQAWDLAASECVSGYPVELARTGR